MSPCDMQGCAPRCSSPPQGVHRIGCTDEIVFVEPGPRRSDSNCIAIDGDGDCARPLEFGERRVESHHRDAAARPALADTSTGRVSIRASFAIFTPSPTGAQVPGGTSGMMTSMAASDAPSEDAASRSASSVALSSATTRSTIDRSATGPSQKTHATSRRSVASGGGGGPPHARRATAPTATRHGFERLFTVVAQRLSMQLNWVRYALRTGDAEPLVKSVKRTCR